MIFKCFSNKLVISTKLIKKNLFLSLDSHELVSLLGSNGVGKTSYLKQLLINYKFSDGFCLSIPYSSAYFYMRTTNSHLSVYSLFQEWANRFDFNINFALSLLYHFGLKKRFHQSFSNLSTGEKQKILIIRLIASNKMALLLDEGFNGLDKAMVLTFKKLIVNHVFVGGGNLCVDHKLKFRYNASLNYNL